MECSYIAYCGYVLFSPHTTLPCLEFPPPPPVRVIPRYVVLDTTTDLVLEARFRGTFHSHEWIYNEDDPTFLPGPTSLFLSANRTNVGQTYTIPVGSASLRVGYYGPRVNPTVASPSILPTPENTVISGSFCKYTDSQKGVHVTLLVRFYV